MNISGSPATRIHTDLALEDTEQFPSASPDEADSKLQGLEVTKHYRFNGKILVTRVNVTSQAAADAIGKPVGVYLTLEAEALRDPDEEIVHAVARELAKQLLLFFRLAGRPLPNPLSASPDSRGDGPDAAPRVIRSVLIAGLGNRAITADALGPRVSEFLNATRHLEDHDGIAVSTIAPGVMAQTGMETADIIRGVVRETVPDLLLVIDALAARSTSRFQSTIQLSDAGIAPGSGVGNHRVGITRESLGIPVLAIGVPTVVDAATIVSDAIDRLLEAPEEKYHLVRELLNPDIGRMDVTPKNIDETILMFARLIAEAIELAVAAYETELLKREGGRDPN